MARFLGMRPGFTALSGAELKALRVSKDVSRHHLALAYGCEGAWIVKIETMESVSFPVATKYRSALDRIAKVPPDQRTEFIIKLGAESLAAGLAELEKLAAYVRGKL